MPIIICTGADFLNEQCFEVFFFSLSLSGKYNHVATRAHYTIAFLGQMSSVITTSPGCVCLQCKAARIAGTFFCFQLNDWQSSLSLSFLLTHSALTDQVLLSWKINNFSRHFSCWTEEVFLMHAIRFYTLKWRGNKLSSALRRRANWHVETADNEEVGDGGGVSSTEAPPPASGTVTKSNRSLEVWEKDVILTL